MHIIRGKLIRNSIVAGLAIAISSIFSPTIPSAFSVWHGYEITGAIEQTYIRLGGHPRFGNATSPAVPLARGGLFQPFERNASIYWHPNIANGTAHEIEGLIRDRWGELSWENGPLGFPVTDELPTLDAVGRYNHFENGSIYWYPGLGANSVQGLIWEKWRTLGFERSNLGLPTTNELTPPDGVGRFNHFQNGSIYWHPNTGAHPVPDPIRQYWKQNGWETGRLGYPTSDPEFLPGDSVKQNFQGGSITVHKRKGKIGETLNQNFSNFQRIYPVVSNDEYKHMGPESAAGLLRTNFAVMTLRSEFDNILQLNKTYQVRAGDGTLAPVTVTRIADDGIELTAGKGHPEGPGRKLILRFENAKRKPDEKNVISDELTGFFYNDSTDNWTRLVIESTGPVEGARVAGMFNDPNIASQIFDPVSHWIQASAATTNQFHYTSDALGNER